MGSKRVWMERGTIMNDYKVYCHTSPNGKRYVGISNNPEKRWNNGKGYIKNYLFYKAIEKYGWDNFTHEILYENLSIDEAGEIEKKLISEWNLTDPNYGYNLREGGNGKFSEHSRYLMSKARKGNTNAAGQYHSLENRKQISESLKEYYKEHPVQKLDMSDNKAYQEIITKRQELTHIKRSLATSGASNPSARPIKQLDKDGNLIEEFAYATLAAKKYNLDLSSIIRCCRGKQKTCGGYKWEYQSNT